MTFLEAGVERGRIDGTVSVSRVAERPDFTVSVGNIVGILFVSKGGGQPRRRGRLGRSAAGGPRPPAGSGRNLGDPVDELTSFSRKLLVSIFGNMRKPAPTERAGATSGEDPRGRRELDGRGEAGSSTESGEEHEEGEAP
jgi:hypothetical protein